jgi:hypothetical protein
MPTEPAVPVDPRVCRYSASLLSVSARAMHVSVSILLNVGAFLESDANPLKHRRWYIPSRVTE